MRFSRFRRHDTEVVSGRELAAVRRSQRDKLNRLPLLSPIIADELPSEEEAIENNRRLKREAQASVRQRRADEWREGRAALYRLSDNIRPLALEYWNTHRWLPASPQHLIAMVGSIESGRLSPEKMATDIRTGRDLTIRFGPVSTGEPPKGWNLK